MHHLLKNFRHLKKNSGLGEISGHFSTTFKISDISEQHPGLKIAAKDAVILCIQLGLITLIHLRIYIHPPS